MKNKLFIVSAIGAALILLGGVCVAGQSHASEKGAATGSTIKSQIQTANQGETNQVQTQIQQQAQGGTTVSTKEANQVRETNQPKIQEGAGVGNQTQNQNQVENQGTNNQVRTEEQQGEQNKNTPASPLAAERRSAVAKAVQELLQVADRVGGIGQQVKNIAQTQNQNQVILEDSLQKIKSQSSLAKFLIGPNYSEIKKAQNILEQNKEQIAQLNQIKTQLTNQGDQQALETQIQTLEQANSAIAASLKEGQRGFSLLGWAFKIFSK